MKLISNFVNLVLTVGAFLLLLFIVLSGSTNHFPFNRFYWVKGETSGITNAYDETAWTYWGICSAADFSECKYGPAYPISPVDNFETSSGVPSDFVDNRDTFYYLTRFSFAFFLLALCFDGFALLVGFFGFCFSVIDRIIIVLVTVALFFNMGAAALQTAANVLARNAFKNDGLSASIGVKMMALCWASVACNMLVFFITCGANIANSYRKHIEHVNESKNPHESYYQHNDAAVGNNEIADDSSFTRGGAAAEKEDSSSGGIRFFRIKRNQKASDEESA